MITISKKKKFRRTNIFIISKLSLISSMNLLLPSAKMVACNLKGCNLKDGREIRSPLMV